MQLRMGQVNGGTGSEDDPDQEWEQLWEDSADEGEAG